MKGGIRGIENIGRYGRDRRIRGYGRNRGAGGIGSNRSDRRF
jgi:hypothetical protein